MNFWCRWFSHHYGSAEFNYKYPRGEYWQDKVYLRRCRRCPQEIIWRLPRMALVDWWELVAQNVVDMTVAVPIQPYDGPPEGPKGAA